MVENWNLILRRKSHHSCWFPKESANEFLLRKPESENNRFSEIIKTEKNEEKSFRSGENSTDQKKRSTSDANKGQSKVQYNESEVTNDVR